VLENRAESDPEMGQKQYVYGPVPSRRLGMSLGVDIVPYKTCTYDCIYCQVGLTTQKTLERKAYVPEEEIISSLQKRIPECPDLDCVTFAGSGEPTLHSGLGNIIRAIRELTDASVVIITNGSLFWDASVRKDCALADIVVPSLDASTPELFEKVNRPHPEIDFYEMIDGLVKFRHEFNGQIWLEVFCVKGLTADDSFVNGISQYVERMSPDKIQLNTAVRPPSEDRALPVPENELKELAKAIGPNCEVIASYSKTPKHELETDKDQILEMLSRRPCTLNDLADGLQVHRNEVLKSLTDLLGEGKIKRIEREGSAYYVPERKMS